MFNKIQKVLCHRYLRLLPYLLMGVILYAHNTLWICVICALIWVAHDFSNTVHHVIEMIELSRENSALRHVMQWSALITKQCCIDLKKGNEDIKLVSIRMSIMHQMTTNTIEDPIKESEFLEKLAEEPELIERYMDKAEEAA